MRSRPGPATNMNTSMNMKPLDIDMEDEQETLSFLPEAPVVHIRVPKRKQKLRCCSCRPWIYKSILFMIIFTAVLSFKSYVAIYGYPFQHKEVAVTKWRDLHLDDIGHWCMQPNVTTCECANPLQPMHRHGHKTWTEAHMQNEKLARNIEQDGIKKSPFREMDVVFLGDSITEGWRGTSFGKAVEKKEEIAIVFDQNFDMDKGGEYDGLVLGIAGDKCQNLLWRIQHGEMPKKLKAKVFWLLIGTNDFLKEGLDQCSEEVVFMGIQRIVEEMMIQKPDATIVINGLLPRSDIGRGNDGRLYEIGTKTVMNAIDAVNIQLEEYCDEHDELEYFDASKIFISTDSNLGKGKYAKFIPKDFMNDSLHPTARAYSYWAKAITEKLETIINGKLTIDRL